MKKWKDIPRNEKWMFLLILLLLAGIFIRWAAVKEGVERGFRWYRSEPTEEPELLDSTPERQIEIQSDTIPAQE